MAEPARSRAREENPYVGPCAFEEEDLDYFFGRRDEIARLRSLAVSRRAVLLYAPSGAGKSSLLKAGLLPELRALGAACLRVARVGGEPPREVEPANLYVFHLLSYLLGESCAPEEIAGLSLSAGLGRVLGAFAEPPEVAFLTVDQCEEIFTTDPYRHAEREDFFRQLQQALADHPELTLLLALREDWLAHLDPHLDRFPDRLRARFRLELLGRKAALEAIIKPASKARVEVLPDAAGLLVDDLLNNPRPGTEVDPVQLQIVCSRLWARRPAGAVKIDAAQVTSSGGAGRALAEYWEERVAEAARETGVPEREIRDWCERELITPQHVRGQVLAGEETTRGLDNRVLETLVDAHLLRPEPRRGAVWYELAHDRLIEPVVRNNRDWREKNATETEKKALLWQESGRLKKKLLRKGKELEEAAREEAAGASPIVREFLARSRERRSNLISAAIVSTVSVLLIVSLLFHGLRAPAIGSWAGYGALSRVRADLDDLARRRADRAALLTLESRRFEDWLHRRTFGGADRKELPDPRLLLFKSLEANPSLVRLVHRPSPRRPAGLRPLLLGDGRTLVEGRRDGTFLLRDAATGAPRSAPVDGGVGAITALAVAPRGNRLAVGGAGGAVQLWDLAPLRPAAEPFQALGEEVLALRFDPDGETLESVHPRATAVWRPHAGPAFGAEVPSFPANVSRTRRESLPGWLELPGVTATARSPGRDPLLATASPEGILLWDLNVERLAAGPFRGHPGEVVRLGFDPAGRWLFSEDLEGRVLRWDVDLGSWEDRARRIAGRSIACEDIQGYFPQGFLARWFLSKVLQYPPSLLCQPDSNGDAP